MAADTRVHDLGVASPTAVKSLTIGLAVRNKAALDAFVAGVANPKSANFRQFVTAAQFAALYGQTPAAVAQVTAFLQAQGFTVTKVYSNNLLIKVTGTNAQIAATFGTPIHAYLDETSGASFEAPSGTVTLPSAISAVTAGVSGLSTRSLLHSHRVAVPNTGALAGDAPATTVAPAVTTGNTPGNWTVTDLANKYDINPLYAKGLSGAGRTVGIATLAGYNQSDAYAYWAALNLPVSAGRITDVLVDGGALSTDGPGSEGSGESTLDVEQSGGVAPGADVRVYIAPNTEDGFIDMFASAVTDDVVDVLSVSWGSPEVTFYPSDLATMDFIFEEAAAQGMPVISAAGDAGAFDINRGYPYPDCTTMLSVDYPASDPYVLAAGGTTLPNSYAHKLGVVTETAERPWGWDYLQSYIVKYYGQSLYYADYYTVGGGGGVSVIWGVPAYQSGLKGMSVSASAQSLYCGPLLPNSGLTSYEDWEDMPAGVAGRNLPDVALNADPYSGYAVYQGGWSGYSGGTSFVAPQLNGILTLISSGVTPTVTNPHGRVGSINPQLYAAFAAQGYTVGSPFRAITTGDNEYYKAAPNFNPASGLGSLDVANLAASLGVQ